jgi:hypothetical protein
VLRPQGVLIAGITNPLRYLFDWDLADRTGVLQVVHSLPYADPASLTDQEKQRYVQDGEPFEFSHTLEDQIGGQLAAGFVLTGFYEDWDRPEDNDPVSRYTASFFATRALKP